MDWLAQLKQEIMRRFLSQSQQHMQPMQPPMGNPLEPQMNPRLAAMRQDTVPVDTMGMDPEMAALMGQESGRLMKQRAVYAPQSLQHR